MLNPDHYYRTVQDIEVDVLRREGIDTLLVDLDNTLLPRNSDVVTEEARAWVSRMSDEGFKVCIVSNNWHERVFGVAEQLGCALVAKAVKPLPFAFRKALRRMNSTHSGAAVIGDQIFTDVLGGRFIGAKTILVTPLSSSDLPHTVVLRRLERAVLAGRRPLP